MRLLAKSISRDYSGHVKVIVEDTEDLWHAYNLILPGDTVRASTMRKVVLQTGAGSSSERVKLTLSLLVVNCEYFDEEQLIKIKGRSVASANSAHANAAVKNNQFHTLDIGLNKEFSLEKDEWDKISLGRIEDACNVTKTADVAAVVLHEGLAHLCLLRNHMTVVCQRIELSFPKHKEDISKREKTCTKFFQIIMAGILRHFEIERLKTIIIASPGFYKDQLIEYIFAEATKADNRKFLENKKKFILLHSSSGHKHALVEMLRDPQVQTKLGDSKFVMESRMLDRFMKMLSNNPERALYGRDHCHFAQSLGAIDVLLVTDTLFRSPNVHVRKEYAQLVNNVTSQGGSSYMYSSLHDTGKQLDQMSGIAAILKFPIDESLLP